MFPAAGGARGRAAAAPAHSPLHPGPAPARRCHGDRGDTVSQLGAFFSARRRGPPPPRARPASRRNPPRPAGGRPERTPGKRSAPKGETGGRKPCREAAGSLPGDGGQSGGGRARAERCHRRRKAAAASGSAAGSPLWVLPGRARALVTARPKGSGSGCTIERGERSVPPAGGRWIGPAVATPPARLGQSEAAAPRSPPALRAEPAVPGSGGAGAFPRFFHKKPGIGAAIASASRP